MSALSRLPNHLRKYVVEQRYDRYTSEDQAVWRFIMRQLREFLSVHAHECYLDGLKKTGISVESIPRIEDVDRMLASFGWGAVPVSGFIPPAAFMEFQSLGVLPIASDMRSLEHLTYTPAPDIVHEAAGHAPILIHPEFAGYLRQYADVAKNAIISKEDMDQYDAIRSLSDIKEDPSSTPEQIKAAEKHLEAVNQKITSVSEAALLSRMNWWTAEYGLIGDLKNPRIYGAGLLSSVGESRQCLSDKVKKLPFDIRCVDFSYDITEQQPQLFVTPDFKTLHSVLDELADRLSFRRGGVYGLEQAKKAATVNTAQLNSGIQISGQLDSFMVNDRGEPVFIKFSGPCQLSCAHKEIANQGTARHAHGFSSPMGRLKGLQKPLSEMSDDELANAGIKVGATIKLQYESGIELEGVLKSKQRDGSQLQILTLAPAKMMRGSEVLFDPAWGEFDLAVGETVISVFGGPADRSRYGETDDFVSKQVPARKLSESDKTRFEFFSRLRECRKSADASQWSMLADKILQDPKLPWLMALELIEMGYALGLSSSPMFQSLQKRIDPQGFSTDDVRQSVSDGLKIANR